MALIADLNLSAASPAPNPNFPPLYGPNNQPIWPAPSPPPTILGPNGQPVPIPQVPAPPISTPAPPPKPPEDPNKEKQDKEKTVARLDLEIATMGLAPFPANLAAPPSDSQKYQLMLKIIDGDPPLSPLLSSTPLPYTTAPGNVADAAVPVSAALPGGAIAGQATSATATISGPLSASWQTSAVSDMAISSLGADGAVITNAQGATVGVGSVSLSVPAPLAASVSGSNTYIIDGNGGLSFYGDAGPGLAVSGDWTNYTATVMGDVGITLTTDGLMLGRTLLPAGTYTISAPSVRISGSGGCTAPNFIGSVSISTTNGMVGLGPASGSVTVAGQTVDPSEGVTLTDYVGTMTVSANGGGTDSVSLNGNAGNVLQVAASHSTLTTDQNTPVTFAANVQTSLADTYNLTANAPPGWTVSIDSTGQRHRDPRAGAPERHVSDPDHRAVADRSRPRGADDRRGDDHADAARHQLRRRDRPAVHRALQRRCSSPRPSAPRSRTSARRPIPTT